MPVFGVPFKCSCGPNYAGRLSQLLLLQQYILMCLMFCCFFSSVFQKQCELRGLTCGGLKREAVQDFLHIL